MKTTENANSMPANARRAFDELKQLGASVKEWGVADGYGDGVAFVLIWANDDGSQVFADTSGNYIREKYIDGRYLNPRGFRQDVHEIFAKYNLVTDWHNHGQVVVYDDFDAPGFNHAEEAKRNAKAAGALAC